MRKKIEHITFALFIFFGVFAQAQENEQPAPEYIKSIVFKGPTQGDQFPVVKLGERITLDFDDLTGTTPDYYFTITHCDHDWEPSDLMKAQYLQGVDNVRFLDFENSFNTLQPYTHFRYSFPNSRLSLKVSGNYIFKVFDDQKELMFSRRFIIYENMVTVGVTVARPRDLQVFNQKQSVQFIINAGNLNLRDPSQEVKTVIVKNYDWNTVITGLKPQFTLGNKLTYRYDKESSFWAGNEFLNFENKDIRGGNVNIARIEWDDIYHHTLYTNVSRANNPYTFFPDINGDFAINIIGNKDPNTEADYAFVYFSLKAEEKIKGKDVHIFGKFNNYSNTEETKMTYNAKRKRYEGSLLLKQGFYNYKYALVNNKGKVDQNAISGNFLNTENQYLVLVYFRVFGEIYDRLIGIGNGNSTTLTN